MTRDFGDVGDLRARSARPRLLSHRLMGRSPKTRTPGAKAGCLKLSQREYSTNIFQGQGFFRYTAVRKCIPARGGAGIHACGKGSLRNRLQPLPCHLDRRRRTRRGLRRSGEIPRMVAVPMPLQGVLPCCRVSFHGVEQAFMPAVKLLKKSASAAEVMDNAQARKNGNSAQAQAQNPRIVL
jgi:hypothetical protein